MESYEVEIDGKTYKGWILQLFRSDVNHTNSVRSIENLNGHSIDRYRFVRVVSLSTMVIYIKDSRRKISTHCQGW